MFDEFSSYSQLVRSLLSYFLTLVSKVGNPHRINEFMPISPLESLYKIVANVLAKRLSLMMDSLVDKNQYAFIKGRQYLEDGVLVVNKVVDFAKRSKEWCYF